MNDVGRKWTIFGVDKFVGGGNFVASRLANGGRDSENLK